jgi:ubiquinone/menaquinone biosynthesis C-methylase UbiE
MGSTESTQRFSRVVDNYVNYRPNYPKGIIDILESNYNISSDKVIADIGFGTGKLSEIFLENGFTVFGVEPNKEMREAGSKILSKYIDSKKLLVYDGTAEETKLQYDSIDLVIVGQAFHWFDLEKTKLEFRRILKQDGLVMLVWNSRKNNTPFLQAYEDYLTNNVSEYSMYTHKNVTEETTRISSFYDQYQQFKLENQQIFDKKSFIGRFLSSSYSPKPEENEYSKIITGLEELFDKYAIENKVSFLYDTEISIGDV